MSRLDFFDGAGGSRQTAPNLPEGFHYWAYLPAGAYVRSPSFSPIYGYCV